LGVAVAGYQTFSSAGAQNGDVVSFAIEDGLKWEIGTGQYNSVAGTLSRTVTQSFDGTTYGTSPISVTTSAQVFISPLAADLQYGTLAGNLVQLDGSARLRAVDGSLVTALNASNIGTGTLGVSRGGTGTGTAFTAGSVVFAGTSGVYSQDNSQLFWDDSTNRLGIGTSNPAGALHVVNNQNATTSLFIGNSSTGASAQTNFQLASGSTSNFNFTVSDYNSYTVMGGYGPCGVLGFVDFDTHIFRTRAASEKMRITSAGNVGIGATSPTTKLTVYDTASDTQIELGYAATYGWKFGRKASDGSLRFTGLNGGSTLTDLLTLSISGNLGLGVTPSAWGSYYPAIEGLGPSAFTIAAKNNSIQIGANFYQNNSFQNLYTSASTKAAKYMIDAPTATHSWHVANSTGSAGGLINGTGNFTQAMTLNSVGQLIIGDTSSSGVRLTVVDTGNTFVATVRGNGGSNILALGTVTGGTNGVPAISGFTSGFGTTTDIVIQPQGGNVGIGTSLPRFKLSIGSIVAGGTTTPDTMDFGGSYSSSPGANAKLRLWYDGSNYMGFGVSPDKLEYIGTQAFYSHVWYAGGAERMRINASAPILCLAGGNTSATGTGIAFPATQSASSDANTLDDYEEGTFTVGISGAGGPTISSQRCNYVKIGKIVHVNIRLNIRIGTATGSQTITSLPYPASTASANYRASGSGFWDNTVTSVINSFCTLDSGSTSLYPYRTIAGSTSPNLWAGADWQSASDTILIFTMTYWTDA
jgi:hypothetical protein